MSKDDMHATGSVPRNRMIRDQHVVVGEPKPRPERRGLRHMRWKPLQRAVVYVMWKKGMSPKEIANFLVLTNLAEINSDCRAARGKDVDASMVSNRNDKAKRMSGAGGRAEVESFAEFIGLAQEMVGAADRRVNQ